jgi:2-polyprenyl-3-methyl-5-hydroxy-6-metoxy-1,4-benzoquinol methylase
MRMSALEVLACPQAGHPLALGSGAEADGEEVREGTLVDGECGRTWPIRGAIPRFAADEGYAASFGEQWNRYRRTQLDRFNGTTISQERFYRGTGWRPEELKGQRILEVGGGAGRFTEVMLDAGAEVYATDRSRAVDACWQNNGPHPDLTVVQADLYASPFRPESFDRVFCYGVLQHTPDVPGAFRRLLPFLRSGGHLAIDVYVVSPGWRHRSRWDAKRLWRPLTRRLPPRLLARIVEWYVPRWLPIDTRLARLPRLGRYLVSIVPCWNYTGLLPLGPDQLREWAILDTFDALAARYDTPQHLPEVRRWFEEARLADIDVRRGGNGILGNARKP